MAPKRVAIEFAYDGSEFYGYQVQPHVRTVQGELERALERIFKTKVATYAAGRTDTGVHACGQVAAFDCPNPRLTEEDVRNALNANLPRDVYVKRAWFVHAAFNPRYEAKRRIYHYFVFNSPRLDVFLRKYTWWFPYKLDIDAMRRAASFLVGEHDFTAFSKKDEEDDRPIRTISSIRILMVRKNTLLVRVEGVSFLRGMVRSIVANLVKVGTLQWEPEMVREILESKDRAKSAGLAPAHGLFLYRVLF